jgi:hypothetical protein
LIGQLVKIKMKKTFAERMSENQNVLPVPPKITVEFMVMATDFHPKKELFGLNFFKLKFDQHSV